MAIARYNLLAKNLPETFALFGLAVNAARGLKVEIGPFDDQLLARLYIWVRGEADTVEFMLRQLLIAAQAENIKFLKTPIDLGRTKET